MQRKWTRFVVATFAVALGAVGLATSGGAVADAAPEVRAASPTAAPVDALAGLVTNGPIYDVERVGDTTYVGGDFDYVAERVGNFVALDSTTGSSVALSTPEPRVVRAESDPSGGWFVATEVPGGPRALARLDSSGQVDWTTDIHCSCPWWAQYGDITRIRVYDGMLLVAGAFTSIGGQARRGLALVDPVTGAVQPWDPQLPVSSRDGFSIVNDAVLAGSVVYTAGNAGLRSVNLANGTLRAFNPTVDSNPSGIEYFDGLILTGGLAFDEFGTPQVTPCILGQRDGDRVIRLVSYYDVTVTVCDLATGNITSSFVIPREVASGFSVQDDVLFVALNDATGLGVEFAAYNLSSGEQIWRRSTNGTGTSVVSVSGSTVGAWNYGMSGIDPKARSNLAAIDADGHLTDWSPSADGNVRSLAVDGDAVIAGGEFTAMSSIPRNRLARLDGRTGTVDPGWDPNANGIVQAVEVDAGVTYAGGAFTQVDGTAHNRIVAIGSDGHPVAGWSTGANSTVTAMKPFNGTLYVAGVFSTIGGEARARLAALDATTGAVAPWDPGADDFVRSIDATADAVYVGGGFLEAGGQPRQRVAAIDPTTGDATSWDPGADAEVWEVSVFEDQVYLGGTFTAVGGQDRRSLAAVTTAGEVTGWDPAPSGVVYSIVTSGGVVSAAGLLGAAPALRAGARASVTSAAAPSDANQLAFAQYQATEATKPTVTITTPVDGADYTRGAAVVADFACADEPGGSGIASCQGTVTDGSPIDTSSLRDHEFTVTATDAAGNVTTQTVTYGVVDRTDPTVTLSTPTNGAVYARSQVVIADYSCDDEAAGSGLVGCIGDVADGAAVDTSTLGEHDFSVTATDGAGNTTTVTHTYTVGDTIDPNIDLRTPPNHIQAFRGAEGATVGALYRRNESVAADYSCSDSGGSGLSSCVGDVADGQPIDTSTAGVHDFTVDAADHAGNTASVTHQYTVADAQPDGAIRTGTMALAGDGVFNTTGRGQRASGSAARGRTITFSVRVQNDAPFADVVRVRGAGSAGQYGVTYWLGQTDVTSQVVAGTFTSASIPANQSVTLKVKVKVKSGATVGSSITGKVTLTSAGDATRQDTVKFTARRA